MPGRAAREFLVAPSGGNPAVRVAVFQNANLNVCFSQQRPFKAEENHENDGQLSAKSGRCDFDQTGRKYKNYQVTSYNVVDLHIRVFLYDTTKFVTTVIPFRVASDIKRDAQ